MSDTMTAEQRRRCMAAIRGKNTRPELMVRRYLHSLGLRYGLHNRRLPGTPDIVLRRLRTVVFIHGCFWHGHEGCRSFKMPKTRVDYWQNKITGNRQRDARAISALTARGWNVIVVWECELRSKEQRIQRLYSLGRELLDIRDARGPEYLPVDYNYDEIDLPTAAESGE